MSPCALTKCVQVALEQQLGGHGAAADGRLIKSIKQCESFLHARESDAAALQALKGQVEQTLSSVQPRRKVRQQQKEVQAAPQQMGSAAPSEAGRESEASLVGCQCYCCLNEPFGTCSSVLPHI